MGSLFLHSQKCYNVGMNKDIIPLSKLLDLSSKSAIVTGGAMGIGFGIAHRLAEAGASVVIVDLDEEMGNRSAEELRKKGWKAAFVKTDVSDESAVGKAVRFAVDIYGGVDILVNNAGIYPLASVIEMNTGMFEKIIAVNLKSVFLFTKAAGEIMIKQGRGGKIINITSIDALHPSFVGLAAYDASKHGVWGFTKNAALELAAHNIQVNAVAPGAIATPGTGEGKIEDDFVKKIPMKRIGSPDDIGRAVLFLASDLSSYMTGSQIVVDGGILLS